MEKAGGRHFGHNLSMIVLSAETIEGTIDAGYVDREWQNKEFVRFMLNYGSVVSSTKKQVIAKLVRGSDSLFKLLDPSDTAWAATMYINNEPNWASKFKAQEAEERALARQEATESRRVAEKAAAKRKEAAEEAKAKKKKSPSDVRDKRRPQTSRRRIARKRAAEKEMKVSGGGGEGKSVH